MSVQVNITENGTTVLATQNTVCREDINVNVNIESKENEIVTRTIKEYTNNEVTNIGKGTFYSCGSLKKVDFALVKNINADAFKYCYSITTVILRNPTVCTLSSISAFSGCMHFTGTQHNSFNPNGLKDGYVYVPDELVESYKIATNWSTYADRIKPISELEG